MDKEIPILVGGNVCMTPYGEDFGKTWTLIPRNTPRYWYYRALIIYRGTRGWLSTIWAMKKSLGWRWIIQNARSLTDITFDLGDGYEMTPGMEVKHGRG